MPFSRRLLLKAFLSVQPGLDFLLEAIPLPTTIQNFLAFQNVSDDVRMYNRFMEIPAIVISLLRVNVTTSHRIVNKKKCFS